MLHSSVSQSLISVAACCPYVVDQFQPAVLSTVALKCYSVASVCLSVCDVRIVAKRRPRPKVTVESL